MPDGSTALLKATLRQKESDKTQVYRDARTCLAPLKGLAQDQLKPSQMVIAAGICYAILIKACISELFSSFRVR